MSGPDERYDEQRRMIRQAQEDRRRWCRPHPMSPDRDTTEQEAKIECQCGCGESFSAGEVHQHKLCDEMIYEGHLEGHITDGECNMQAFWALKH